MNPSGQPLNNQAFPASKSNIPLEEVHFHSTSFMDPNGKVFVWKGKLYRALFQGKSEFYKSFIESNTYSELSSEGKMVETQWTPLHLEGFESVLKHRLIQFPSYCMEWPPEMLRDAALLTVDLCLKLIDDNLTLQDSYPWNILFEGTRPVFIDFGSIVSVNPSFLWIPYQQFCDFFYHPLLLQATNYRAVSRKFLFDYLDGVPAEQLVRLLNPLQKIRLPGYFTRVSIPHALSRRMSSAKWEKKLQQSTKGLTQHISKANRKTFFRKLYKTIERIKFPAQKTVWNAYYSSTDEEQTRKKQNCVQKVLDRVGPKTVLDIGSNEGLFSSLAGRFGASVVAFEPDEQCVSQLYCRAKEKNLRVLPLVMDILNPTPSFGWCGKQFEPAWERFKADLVLVLALIHHLVFTKGQNFPRIIESIKAFQKEYALYEFVAKEDPMAARLRRRISFDDEWYTLSYFQKTLEDHYKSVEIIEKVSDTRTLILCRR